MTDPAKIAAELEKVLTEAADTLSSTALMLCVPYAGVASPEMVPASLAGATVNALVRLTRSYALGVQEGQYTQQQANQRSRDAVIYIVDIIMRSCRANGINVMYVDDGGTGKRATMQ